MARSTIYRSGRAQLTFNMTPMIDCTFQLIIFFMLTTQMASADYVTMKLPDPDTSVARTYEVNRVIVNIVPYSSGRVSREPALRGAALEYRLGIYRVEKANVGKLVRELLRVQRESPRPEDFVVELRADRSISYSEIEPVLLALQEAELGRMHITALRELRGD